MGSRAEALWVVGATRWWEAAVMRGDGSGGRRRRGAAAASGGTGTLEVARAAREREGNEPGKEKEKETPGKEGKENGRDGAVAFAVNSDVQQG